MSEIDILNNNNITAAPRFIDESMKPNIASLIHNKPKVDNAQPVSNRFMPLNTLKVKNISSIPLTPKEPVYTPQTNFQGNTNSSQEPPAEQPEKKWYQTKKFYYILFGVVVLLFLVFIIYYFTCKKNTELQLKESIKPPEIAEPVVNKSRLLNNVLEDTESIDFNNDISKYQKSKNEIMETGSVDSIPVLEDKNLTLSPIEEGNEDEEEENEENENDVYLKQIIKNVDEETENEEERDEEDGDRDDDRKFIELNADNETSYDIESEKVENDTSTKSTLVTSVDDLFN